MINWSMSNRGGPMTARWPCLRWLLCAQFTPSRDVDPPSVLYLWAADINVVIVELAYISIFSFPTIHFDFCRGHSLWIPSFPVRTVVSLSLIWQQLYFIRMISRLGPVVFVAICVMSTIAVPLPDDSQSSLLSETQVRLQFSKVPPRLFRLTTLPHSLHFSVSWENSSGYMARRAAFHPMIRQ